MRRAIRDLKNWLGRIIRDIEWKSIGIVLSESQQLLLATAKKLYAQNQETPGKDRVRYEYGNKVSIIKSNDKNIILNVEHCPGNPYDGHTLAKTVSGCETMTGVPVRE